YTRKSSEEGLEQAFNSLDAQREACAAFILSQKHEGWTVLPTLYDDGGFSGGTMERPALKRLIADIEAGQIDVVVVYKVDRLTRALSDFAKLVEVFDRRREMRMLVENADDQTPADPSLLRIIARAHHAQARLIQNPKLTVHDIAREEQVSAAYLYSLLRLPWLAPDITTAIINGRKPPQLTAQTLMRLTPRLPAGWAEQRKLLGFRL